MKKNVSQKKQKSNISSKKNQNSVSKLDSVRTLILEIVKMIEKSFMSFILPPSMCQPRLLSYVSIMPPKRMKDLSALTHFHKEAESKDALISDRRIFA